MLANWFTGLRHKLKSKCASQSQTEARSEARIQSACNAFFSRHESLRKSGQLHSVSLLLPGFKILSSDMEALFREKARGEVLFLTGSESSPFRGEALTLEISFCGRKAASIEIGADFYAASDPSAKFSKPSPAFLYKVFSGVLEKIAGRLG